MVFVTTLPAWESKKFASLPILDLNDLCSSASKPAHTFADDSNLHPSYSTTELISATKAASSKFSLAHFLWEVIATISKTSENVLDFNIEINLVILTNKEIEVCI